MVVVEVSSGSFPERGASEGRDPHPAFDLEWYARHYLSGSDPSAEALLHFMTIGIDTGAAPDPRLATPEQGLRGQVKIVATRGRMVRVVQLGFREKMGWKEAKAKAGGFVRDGESYCFPSLFWMRLEERVDMI